MSRLFAKRLYLTPLLAAKQSPRCRFPTRSLNSSANLHNLTVSSAVQGNEVSDNANPRRLSTLQDEDRLIGRVSKLEDRAHSSDDRFVASVKDSAVLQVDVTKAIGDIRLAMEATMAKHYGELKTDIAKIHVELKTDMAKLSADMGKIHVELKTDMAKLSTDMGKMYGELKTDIAKNHGEFKSEMGKLYADLGKTGEGVKSLRWQVKCIYGAAIVVVGSIATKYPDEFLSFLQSVLARATPQSCQS